MILSLLTLCVVDFFTTEGDDSAVNAYDTNLESVMLEPESMVLENPVMCEGDVELVTMNSTFNSQLGSLETPPKLMPGGFPTHGGVSHLDSTTLASLASLETCVLKPGGLAGPRPQHSVLEVTSVTPKESTVTSLGSTTNSVSSVALPPPLPPAMSIELVESSDA